MTGLYRYCTWSKLLCAPCVGWEIAGGLEESYHGAWSVLVCWPHETDPPPWPFMAETPSVELGG